MNRTILSVLTFVSVVLAIGAADCRAAAVTVEIEGEVWGNQISDGELGAVQPGETAWISFTVDPDDFTDSPDFPTRGYVIDLASFELSFSGGTSIGLAPSFAGPAYFVLRDNDPAVDGFFLSVGTDLATPLDLDQAAQTAEYFGVRFNVGYEGDTLDSLDILDAAGSYDFTGLKVFGMGVNDGPNEDVLGMDFSSMAVTAGAPDRPIPLTPADGAVDVEPPSELTWQGVGNCPGEFTSLNVPGGQATWISPDGETVIGTSQGENGGWIWTADTGVTNVPSSTKFVGQAGNDFPAAGNARNANDETEAAIWNAIDDQPQLLGGVPNGAHLDGVWSSAYGISGDGGTVVGLAYDNEASAHAFLWTSGTGMTALPKLSEDENARANGVNHDGSIVWGWNANEFGFWRGVRWVNGTPEELLNSEGGVVGEATGASRDGSVIIGGGLGTAGQEGHAWRWTAENGAVSIGDLVDFFGSNFAFGTSDDGNVIVGTTGFGIDRNATLWTAASGELRWLSDVLEELDIAVPAGWHLNTALAVSADGTIIAGWGSDGTGINSFLINLQGDAFEYRLQVATDAGFNDIVIDETVAGTSLIPEQALTGGQEYFWRVQGVAGCGETDWSEVFSFTTAAPVPGVLEVEPAALDFGDTVVDSTEIAEVSISNTAAAGAADLVLTQIEVISGDPEFAIGGGDCGATLAPQDSCTVEVHFAPAADQPYAGVLRINAEDNSAINVSLSGAGVDPENPGNEIFSDRFEQ